MQILQRTHSAVAKRSGLREPRWVKYALISIALIFLTVFLFAPILVVIFTGLNKGIGFYLKSIVEPDALAAIQLTLLAAGISVPLNVLFGLASAWAILPSLPLMEATLEVTR